MATDQKKILIVEDEKPLAHALELKLVHEGFTVKVASDGQQCLDMLKEEKFDVLLLDLVMPILDGFQVLESLKKDNSTKPVVFVLSNLSQHEDEERVRSLGARRFFIKSDTPLTTIVAEVKSI
jgi:two-component system alkaline phosphatase synthesis response regulator PhoP